MAIWYGTRKFVTEPPVIFVLFSDGAIGYFKGSVNGATGYFTALFERGERLFSRTLILGQ